jgi:hypothetical protein
MKELITNPIWILITITNICVVFLIMLNDYLQGSYKHWLEAILGFLIVAILITLFILYGWLVALFHLIGSFIFGASVQPYAAKVAARLMK